MFFYDVITFKRGGWMVPRFGASPFAATVGPNLHLKVLGMGMLSMGVAKMLAAVAQGLPSLVMGAWLGILGLFICLWQTGLCKLFHRRYRPIIKPLDASERLEPFTSPSGRSASGKTGN